jgi:rare lipoprotein A
MNLRTIFALAAVAFLSLNFLTGCATNSGMSSVGQTEHGYASWYGTENGTRTASGESFSCAKLTAAHRHLPFGTIVRVTNEQNGKTVDVCINDRGPWAGGGRIIDVSSAAADELDMKRAGIVPVDVEILEVGSGRRTAP